METTMRYVVTTRRGLTDAVPNARDVLAEAGLQPLPHSDPDTVMVLATPRQAADLRSKYGASHVVEAEILSRTA
jgi:hypothetical protein